MVKELGEELGEGDARATSFDECWSAYPVHRYRANAEAEFDTAIESGVSAESILTACKRVPRTHTQTLGFFIADGTWLDYAVKTKPPAEPCPDCDNGWVLEGETAVPCPKCAVPS
jgi:hypothetical protein